MRRIPFVNELQQVVQAQHALGAVKSSVARPQLGHALPTAQSCKLSPREVFSEPAVERHPVNHFRGVAIGKLWVIGHVCCA